MAPKQSRAFCFTLNNPSRFDFPKDWYHAKDIVFAVWQVERGTAGGTEHLQGYVITKENPKSKAGYSIKWCKENLNGKAHWEVRMGTHQQAVDYCKKEDTRVKVEVRNALGQPFHARSFDGGFGPWTVGEWKDQETTRAEVGERRKATLLDVKASIDAGATEGMLWDRHFGQMTRYHNAFKQYQLVSQVGERRQPYIMCFWGEPGCGKSTRAKAIADKNGGAFWFSSAHNSWWDGYNPSQHNVVVLDDFKGNIPYHVLLRICDRYPLQVEIKGSTVAFNPAIIIITSNTPPNQWYFQDNINFDHSALLRRLDKPFGMTIEMKKTAGFQEPPTDLPSIEDALEDIESGAFFNALDKEVTEAAKAIIDLTDDDFVEDDEEAIARAEQASMAMGEYESDSYEFNEPDLGDGAQPGGAVSITHALDRDLEASPKFVSARSLRRTDEASLTFNTPLNRAGTFKKVGPEPVQTVLRFMHEGETKDAKRRRLHGQVPIKVSMANHDDDGDE